MILMKDIIREGNPLLREKSAEVSLPLSKEDEDILVSMIEYIDNSIDEEIAEKYGLRAAVGIAAPQIGIDKKIVLINVEPEKCYYQDSEEIKDLILINPVWKNVSNEKYSEYEGCLSVPEIRGKVERFYKIELEYLDENFNKQKRVLSGFSARVVQHECDHLNGIVFLNKVSKNGFATKKTIDMFNLREI